MTLFSGKETYHLNLPEVILDDSGSDKFISSVGRIGGEDG